VLHPNIEFNISLDLMIMAALVRLVHFISNTSFLGLDSALF